MKRYVRNSVTILLLFWLLGNHAAAAEPLIPSGDISADGSQVVWSGSVNDHTEIFYIADATASTVQITHHQSHKRDPDIDDHWIVWQDNRNYLDEEISQYDIYAYNLTTQNEIQVSKTVGNHEEPKVDGNYLVWRDTSNGQSNVMLYDINSDEYRQITTDTQAFGIEISGDQIVWMQYESPYFDIYTYDISSDTTTRITHGDGDHKDPVISGDTILWHDYRDEQREIYKYDLHQNVEQKLTEGSGDKIIQGVHDNQILFENESSAEINIQNLDTGEIEALDSALLNETIIFQGDQIMTVLGGQVRIQSTHSLYIENSVDTLDSSEEKHPITPMPENFTHIVSEDGMLQIMSSDEKTGILNNIQISTFEAPSAGSLHFVGKGYHLEQKGKEEGTITLLFQNSDGIAPVTAIYGRAMGGEDWTYLGGGIFQAERSININLSTIQEVILGYPTRKFTDTENHWAKESIQLLSAHGVVNGYKENIFMPNRNISRAEFVTLILKAINHDEEPSNKIEFTDVSSEHWAYENIQAAASLGLAIGNGEQFFPDRTITREEMVSIMVRAIALETGSVESEQSGAINNFTDAAEVNVWSEETFQFALEHGLIYGKTEKLLAPQVVATRAEAAVITIRMIRYLEERMNADVE